MLTFYFQIAVNFKYSRRKNIWTTWNLIKYASELDMSTLQTQMSDLFHSINWDCGIHIGTRYNCRDVVLPEEWPTSRHLSLFIIKMQRSYTVLWYCPSLPMIKLQQNGTKTRNQLDIHLRHSNSGSRRSYWFLSVNF